MERLVHSGFCGIHLRGRRLGRSEKRIVLGLRNEIDSLKVEIVNLKAASFRNKVIYPTLAAVIGGVTTALIIIVMTGNK